MVKNVKLNNNVKVPLQYIASIFPKRIFESKEYKEYKILLEETKNWDSPRIEEFQNIQLRLLIHQAFNYVPFYQKYWEEYGINIKDIQSINDMKILPTINKDTVKKYRDEFLAGNFKLNGLNKVVTGGTTSLPLHLFNTKTAQLRELAIYEQIWTKYSYTNQKCLMLRHSNTKNLYRYNPYRKQILVNIIGFDEEKIEKIINLITNLKPSFIQAYPSIIYLLSKYINDQGLSGKIGEIKAVFCSSEKMFAFQREEIKKAFNCNVIDYYGHSEGAALLEWCPEHQLYEAKMEYGIVEFLNNHGEKVESEDQLAEIVGTGFNNYAFPLIRYRTGDVVKMGSQIEYCNYNNFRGLSVKEIEGRSSDMLKTSDGKLHSPTVLEFLIDTAKHFKEFQLIQEDIDYLKVLIIPSKHYKEEDGVNFKYTLKELIRSDINIEIEIVPEIKRPKNQKHRFLISQIS